MSSYIVKGVLWVFVALAMATVANAQCIRCDRICVGEPLTGYQVCKLLATGQCIQKLACSLLPIPPDPEKPIVAAQALFYSYSVGVPGVAVTYPSVANVTDAESVVADHLGTSTENVYLKSHAVYVLGPEAIRSDEGLTFGSSGVMLRMNTEAEGEVEARLCKFDEDNVVEVIGTGTIPEGGALVAPATIGGMDLIVVVRYLAGMSQSEFEARGGTLQTDARDDAKNHISMPTYATTDVSVSESCWE